MSDLIRSTARGDYGNTVDLPTVRIYAGDSTRYIKLVSNSFAAENEVNPVTVRISEARLSEEVNGIGARPNMTFVPDRATREIKAVVEWERGGARFALECDPGSTFVLDATSVTVTARVDLNYEPRRMSASVSRGALPSPKCPTFTTMPIVVGRAWPLNPNFFCYVPPFAKSFRVASVNATEAGYDLMNPSGIIGVVTRGRENNGTSQRSNETIWVTNWEQEIPLPSAANCLYLMSATYLARAIVQFNLAP